MDDVSEIRDRIDPEADALLAPAPVTVAEGIAPGQKSLSPGQAALRRFLRDKRAVLSLAFVLVVIVGSFVFPYAYLHIGPSFIGGATGNQLITPAQYHTPAWEELTQTNAPSTLLPFGPHSLMYPMGTDANGRDLFAELMAGVKVSVTIAFSVEIFDIGLGILFGSLAGFFGGWLDTVLARFTDIMFAFPGLLLIILIGASLGPVLDNFLPGGQGRVLLLIGAFGFLAWPLMMRQVRSQTLALKEQQYIEAARTVGTTSRGIITRHIIPNLLSIVIVTATLDVLGTIVGEAAISLIGVGIQPPQLSLGLMINNAVGQIYTSWTELAWPGGTLVALVVALAFIGDGVRDAFDPRTKD